MKVFDFPDSIRCRDDFGSLLNDRGLLGHAVEIGVRHGYFSLQLLEQWKGQKISLVDPWGLSDEYSEYKDNDWNDIYNKAMQRFTPHEDRVEVLRMTSMEAAAQLPDDLDFVYIDGNHRYSFVMQDLTTWWKKIKSGGILAGHDLFLPHIDVTNAVIEFCLSKSIVASVIPPTYNKHRVTIAAGSYWMVKE